MGSIANLSEVAEKKEEIGLVRIQLFEATHNLLSLLALLSP